MKATRNWEYTLKSLIYRQLHTQYNKPSFNHHLNLCCKVNITKRPIRVCPVRKK